MVRPEATTIRGGYRWRPSGRVTSFSARPPVPYRRLLAKITRIRPRASPWPPHGRRVRGRGRGDQSGLALQQLPELLHAHAAIPDESAQRAGVKLPGQGDRE